MKMQAMAPSTHQRRFRLFSAMAPKHAMNGSSPTRTLRSDSACDMVPAVNPKPVRVPIIEMS